MGSAGDAPQRPGGDREGGEIDLAPLADLRDCRRDAGQPRGIVHLPIGDLRFRRLARLPQVEDRLRQRAQHAVQVVANRQARLHLPPVLRRQPGHRGEQLFDVKALAQGPVHAAHLVGGTVGNLGEGKGPSFYRGSELAKDLEGAPVTSPVYAKEACGFIDANKDKPFFLYLSFNAVHSPIVASPQWLEKFKHLDKRQQGYAALIGEADEAIGTVMTKLRDLKLEENTLIFCISDNGGANALAEQSGLRGSKWFVWEGGIRVTWMVQWKGTIPGNRVVNDPAIQLDVLPTSLAAAGAEKPSVELDGVNLLPLLKGEDDKLAPRELYFRFGVQHAVRQGDWKLVKASKDMEPILVNLATDPGEQKDISAENPTKKVELTALFDKWNASMQPPRWEDLRWNGDPDRKADKKPKKGKKKAK
mgnify:CR=1 FL=1